MRKLILSIALWLCTAHLLLANMASPLQIGTQSGSAFSSRNLDVLFEKIRFTPTADFSTARIDVEYTISVDRSGVTIPLAFYAMDFEGDFQVWLDGNAMGAQQPYDLIWNNDSVKLDFPSLFGPVPGHFGNGVMNVDLGPGFLAEISPEDLHYFQMALDSGTHLVKVSYTARNWEDRTDWIKNVEFRYSLTPAKYWRKFGAIEVTVDAQAVKLPLTSNLGKPHFGRLDSVATWMFGQMPKETILLGLKAEMPSSAQTLINIGPTGMMFIFSGVVALVHLFLTFRYRRRNPTKKWSWIVLAGGILLPFVMLGSYMFALDWIDSAIGDLASKRHGYSFLIMIYYVVLMPVYLAVCFVIDLLYRGWLGKRAA